MIVQKFIAPSEFRALACKGNVAGFGVRSSAPILKTANSGARIVPWELSNGQVDRMGDTINPEGWDLVQYRRNPVVLFGHDSLAPPIGRMGGLAVTVGKLVGNVEFASADVYPFADTICRLVQGGFVKAGSVGFRPKKWAFSTDKNRPQGIDFLECELLEFSVVSIPANAGALVLDHSKSATASRLKKSPAKSDWERHVEVVAMQIEAARSLLRDDPWNRDVKAKLRHYEREQREIESISRYSR